MSADKTYTVIALSVGGRNNKIYYSGEKVTADNFPDGNADELVKQGFLKKNWTDVIKKEEPIPVNNQGKKK